MLILAIDCSEKTSSVAIVRDGELAAQTSVSNKGRDHSGSLLPSIESLMASAGLSFDDVDCFAVSAGPGSFTGVRIGVSTVKGLAFGRGKICAGVSTLEALACNFTDTDGLICPVLDARRGNLYNALFRVRNGEIERLTEDRLISARDLASELAFYDETVYFCGGGYDIMLSETSGNGRIAGVSPLRRYQTGYGVALAAQKKIDRGQISDDVSLAPTYLRPSSAERLKDRNGSRKTRETD